MVQWWVVGIFFKPKEINLHSVGAVSMIMYDLCHRYRRIVLRDEAAILIVLIPFHNSILEMTMSRQEEPT